MVRRVFLSENFFLSKSIFLFSEFKQCFNDANLQKHEFAYVILLIGSA